MKEYSYFVFDVEIYSARIYVLYNNTLEETKSFFKDFFPGVNHNRIIGYEASTIVCVREDGLQEYIIYFRRKPRKKSAFDHGTISHEVCHVVFEISDRISLYYSYDSQEAFAYLHGFITQKIIEGLWNN
jgi:hypothetical protein